MEKCQNPRPNTLVLRLNEDQYLVANIHPAMNGDPIDELNVYISKDPEGFGIETFLYRMRKAILSDGTEHPREQISPDILSVTRYEPTIKDELPGTEFFDISKGERHE